MGWMLQVDEPLQTLGDVINEVYPEAAGSPSGFGGDHSTMAMAWMTGYDPWIRARRACRPSERVRTAFPVPTGPRAPGACHSGTKGHCPSQASLANPPPPPRRGVLKGRDFFFC